jgi:hypothetical protein
MKGLAEKGSWKLLKTKDETKGVLGKEKTLHG